MDADQERRRTQKGGTIALDLCVCQRELVLPQADTPFLLFQTPGTTCRPNVRDNHSKRQTAEGAYASPPSSGDCFAEVAVILMRETAKARRCAVIEEIAEVVRLKGGEDTTTNEEACARIEQRTPHTSRAVLMFVGKRGKSRFLLQRPHSPVQILCLAGTRYTFHMQTGWSVPTPVTVVSVPPYFRKQKVVLNRPPFRQESFF